MSIQPDNRFVDTEPWIDAADLSAPERAEFDAPAWLLVWRKFRRHKLGLVSGLFLLLCYLILPVAGFVAPYTANERSADYLYHPPQDINLWHKGQFIGPYVYPTTAIADLENYRWRYDVDTTTPMPLEFFCEGANYKIAGFIPSNTHLFCAPTGATVFLWGSDRLGRDVFSRILYGAQLSLTVGIIGITVSFVLGIFFGANWGPVSVFFIISIILGILDWPGLARAVRAKFLSLREEEYVRAAEMMGAKPSRVIRRHLLPNFMSHLIASATLSIPAMILGETALSFLGLGLRAPAVSWGVMLNDAQNLASIEIYPWTAIPMLPIIVVVLAFNFLGDGLRASLDPYRS